jgi:hypothetical protein
MKDIYMMANSDLAKPWRADINFEQGDMDLLPGTSDNNDKQRAVIAAIMELGSVPGAENIGIDWAGYVSGSKNMVQINNQIQMRVMAITGSANTVLPVFKIDKHGALNLVMLEISEVAGVTQA